MAVSIEFTGFELPAVLDPELTKQRTKAGIQTVMANFNAAMQVANVIPQNTGALATAINASIVVTETEGRIGTPFKYDLVMEKGRTPGEPMPPVDALIPWVRAKIRPRPKKSKRAKKARAKQARQLGATFKALGVGKEEIKGAKKALKKVTQEQVERSVAFAIAIKIHREGIAVPLTADGRGNHYERTFDAEFGNFQAWFNEGFLSTVA